MIQVNNVVKEFDGFRALDGVNMNVNKGDIYGLVGPNGAGKSTLIRHLTGVYRQNAGEIFIDGQPVYENRDIKDKIAYIPDDLFYYMQADTLDMMKFYKGTYSNFDVNPVMRRQIWTILMSEVEDKKMTVLVSSHNLRELEDVCDHVGIMNKGKVIIERSLSELQGNISKIQVACPVGMPKLPPEYKVLHMSNTGRVYTMIVKGNPKEIVQAIVTDQGRPVVVDALPLTLEEIFIYEMGGEDYEVKDILF